MNWRSYLRSRTRQPAFLWRMVLSILAVGIILGFLAEKFVDTQSGRTLRDESSTNQRGGWQEVEKLAEEGKWSDVWWRMPTYIYYGYEKLGFLTLGIITGLCWFTFLAQIVGLNSIRDPKLWMMLLGVGLGILSIWPTGFFIVWQEIGWGLQESADLIPGLRSMVIGVGLREEAAKLICLLPLLMLVRKQSELLALVLSACVGLGFAIEENVAYFFKQQGTSTMGRFLIANPLHMALTGLIGLNLHRALRYPRDWSLHALGMFCLMVVAHGVYDAAIVLPALAQYGILSTIVFALVIYQFFGEIRALYTRTGEVVSLTANFLCGVSVVTAATFVFFCALLLGSALLAILYFPVA